MSQDVLATFTRDGSTIYTNVLVQLDYVADMEMHVAGGMIPFYRYAGYVTQILDLRQNDYIQDQLNKDPVTGTARMFQIVGRPESFPDQHMEFRADDARTGGFS